MVGKKTYDGEVRRVQDLLDQIAKLALRNRLMLT
jgi:hypothetical protein